MAKNTQPIAKRCKALGISPAVMGYNKKETTRNSNTQNRRPSPPHTHIHKHILQKHVPPHWLYFMSFLE